MVAVLFISFMVYLPSLQNGFVNWDDSANIYENFYITNITDWESLLNYVKGIFSTTVIGNYNPLTIFTFALEKIFYGLDNPGYWHLDNIILHVLCVLLIFRISLALNLELIPAAFCALLFGIHPMRVESVAWITERKDVLYGFFYLFALYYYIKSVKSSFRQRYVFLITLSFILSLLAKIQAVTLPLSMLLVDYYFDRKFDWRLVYEKWLYFALSLATGIVGIYFLANTGMLASEKFLPLFSRIFIGTYTYTVYLIKSIVPYEMVPWYPYPDRINWLYYASVLPTLTVLGSIYYFYRKKSKILVFGLLFFTFNIMFLLQILSAGQGFLADRFTYIAYFGLFFIYAYLFQLFLAGYRDFKKVIYIIMIVILGIFGYINFKQNLIWENGMTLWSHVLRHYPDSYIAMRSRANYYREQGQIQPALHDYDRAVAADPDNPKAYNSRGLLNYELSLDTNDAEKLILALQDFSRAIQLKPGVGEFYINRGLTYYKLNMLPEALRDFAEAEHLDSRNNNIYYNRSMIYIQLEQYHKAQSDIEKYVRLNPYNSDMWSNLGMVYRINKQYQKSLNAFDKAIQMNPDRLFYYNNRLITYYEMGDIERARNELNYLKSKGFKEINPFYEKMLYNNR